MVSALGLNKDTEDVSFLFIQILLVPLELEVQ